MKKKVGLALIALVLAVVLVAVFVGCTPKDAAATQIFGKELLRLDAQFDILTNLDNGAADIGVMDSIMGGYYATHGQYADKIMMVDYLSFPAEEYGIGAKKGNVALMQKINEGLIAVAKDTSANGLGALAAAFGVENEVLVDAATTNPITDAQATDDSWTKVVQANKLIVAYTVFAPIAYEDETTDQLTGFDIELARKVVAYLNDRYAASIQLEFLEIDWDTKVTQLENGAVDLVWNGMTLTDEVKTNMTTGIPYLANKQALIVLKSDADKYGDARNFFLNAKDAIVAVESGSAADLLMTIAQ